jgi:hypothetical protein
MADNIHRGVHQYLSAVSCNFDLSEFATIFAVANISWVPAQAGTQEMVVRASTP